MGAVQFDRAFGNVVEARRHGQHSGFATAGMPDQTDEFALLYLKVKVFDHGERPFGGGIDLVQLAEIDKAVGDQPVLRRDHSRGNPVDRRHLRQHPGFGNLGVDADFHQVIGDSTAQCLERGIMVHRRAVTRAGQFNGELLPQPPFRRQGQDAISQQDSLVHIIGDQDAGLFIRFQYRQNLIRQIGAGQGVKCGQRFVQQQQIGRQGQCARHGDPLAHAAGQFGRPALGSVGQADHADEMIGAGDFFGL